MYKEKTCVCASKLVHTHINATCAHFLTQNLTKIVLIVHYYVMTLSLKFHKDPGFCCKDIHKMILNMHARGKNEHMKF